MAGRRYEHSRFCEFRSRPWRLAFFAFLFMALQSHIGLSRQKAETPPRLHLLADELGGLCNYIFKPSFPWVDKELLQEKVLRLKYRVTSSPKDRPGFPVYFIVYSQRLQRGVLLNVNWNGERCGEFTILNNAGIEMKGGSWEIDQHSPPLGGIWTQENLRRQLGKISQMRTSLEINPRRTSRGCGTWGSYLDPGK